MPERKGKPFKSKGFLRNFEAYEYWINGDGSPRSIPIQELTLQIEPEDFEAVQKALEETKGRDAATNIVGKKAVSLEFPNSNFDVIGDYTLGTRGTVYSSRDGTQKYEGYIGGYDDLYDYDPKPIGVRKGYAEIATRIGALGGIIAGRHADYPIQIEGRIPVRKIYKNDK